MSDFGSESQFEQSGYDIHDHMNNDFPHDPAYIISKSLSAEESCFDNSTISPLLDSSRSLHGSVPAMTHSPVVSGTSTSSSAMGSPLIAMHQEAETHFDWTKGSWGIAGEPGIYHGEAFPPTFANGQIEDAEPFSMPEATDQALAVAPGLVQPFDHSFYQSTMNPAYDGFIAELHGQMPPPMFALQSSTAPFESPSTISSMGQAAPNPTYSSHNGMSRQPSVGSLESFSKGSPSSLNTGFEDDNHERGRCPYPGCGRIFKDLRAHKLTHQSERPEKCPIEKCQYHVKGFARKYDQTRHTLTHYKGTMVCGFCPGSGSASEKSFNRADVFKRHLTSVHGVEQMPSNSRRKSPAASKKISPLEENKEGKCSTCSNVFNNAQEFYNHLDDCVMKILEKPEASESHNERHLLEVANDQNVKSTLERNNLPVEIDNELCNGSDEDDEEMEEDDEEVSSAKGSLSSHRIGKSGRGMTRSKGGVPTVSKGRRKRKDYPHSWGCSKDQMKMKKRVLCVFDGQRRLWKDEMMMDNEYEVRVPLPSGDNKYVTDLDVMTLRRAHHMHNATDAEKGDWLKDEEVTKLML